MRWMGRDRGIDRRLLKPAILDTEEPLGIAESRTQRVAGARQSAIIEAPGRYVLRYKLVFHKKGDGVWAGELETGKRELVVSAAAGADDNMGA